MRLEPLREAVREEVRAAVDVDPDAWTLMGSCPLGERFGDWWAAALRREASGERVSYAVVRRAGVERVVGVTSFKAIAPEHARVEIGATFLHPDARSGATNPSMKRLMLAHAFACGARRVEIRTDGRNARSQAAIARLGAVREGVLRRHERLWTAVVRDTVVFAVTDLDWPAVRDGLDARLAAFAER